MTDKTPTGIDEFDRLYGGAYRGRALLVSGPGKSGKSVAAFHFVSRGLRMQERCLMLTLKSAKDVLIEGDALGMRFTPAVDAGNLVLLEYNDYVPGRDGGAMVTLPPEGFQQLSDIVQEQAIDRIVLDTVLPWVAIPNRDRLAEHVFSFVRTFERMGVTSLFTIPKASSLGAARLHKLIDDLVPISIALVHDTDGEGWTMIVGKYLGMDDKVGAEFPFRIEAGKGIVPGRRPAPSVAEEREAGPVGRPAAAEGPERVRFSNAVLGDV
jgi:KaiC/GvpD/RAD55 family RecA-like ATPase